MYTPLPARLRPESLDDMLGQKHLLGPGKPLRNIIESGNIPNMIFYGCAGIGKTTLAQIIAKQTDKTLYKLNATTANTDNIKEVIQQIGALGNDKGIILYLDEMQYFTKKQQQILLEFIENGSITLIASTSENPYFYIYGAIISRCTVFEFRPLEKSDLEVAVQRGFAAMEEPNITLTVEEGVVSHIASTCGGDVRKALNTVEVLCSRKAGQKEVNVTLEAAKEVSKKSSMRYDRDGDSHYDILSAFQKSIRGSDPDGAVHYLARLVLAEDLPSICRRLLVIAAEDIGLAYPQAISVVKSCVDAALQLGFPEARIPLAEATLLLATAPKSNSAICAVDEAMERIKSAGAGDIPSHLKDSHYGGAEKLDHGTGYKYPHAYPSHYVKQQYLPDHLKGDRYYAYGENKTEQAAKKNRDLIKGEEK
ncbi:MAG: replication-associated recombination protein A [Clostridia bacterium]|nr:replication-associated recombination protein A [Clostridia bacterium]